MVPTSKKSRYSANLFQAHLGYGNASALLCYVLHQCHAKTTKEHHNKFRQNLDYKRQWIFSRKIATKAGSEIWTLQRSEWFDDCNLHADLGSTKKEDKITFGFWIEVRFFMNNVLNIVGLKHIIILADDAAYMTDFRYEGVGERVLDAGSWQIPIRCMLTSCYWLSTWVVK